MIKLSAPEPSFLRSRIATTLQDGADFAVIGLPYGVPYEPRGLHSDAANAPAELRKRSLRLASHGDKYDWDLGGTMFGSTAAALMDCGDVVGSFDPQENRDNARNAVKALLESGTMPIILGGDDSIPAIAVSAFEDHGPINVLQIDAHIDFRNEVNGNTEGYSSPMRRISEMGWVNRIVQVGARGTGSAGPGDVADAREAGSIIVTADELHEQGLQAVAEHIDDSAPWFVTVDMDGFDPSVAPGTSAPLPGGLTYHQGRRILTHVMDTSKICGIDFVEHFPSLDVRDATSLVIARLMINVIGHTARG